MSVGNVKPIKPIKTDNNYSVTVQYKPAAPNDPIPWYVSVESCGGRIGGGWNGTRDECLERAREIIAADELRGEIELLTMTHGGEII